ncbi:MAG TPA: hypothetical protein VIP82_15405 [Microbacterium sp.]|uniref:hypothetical protein n=1 Tax=Microbacterium sp. TaxID=51671 RepID=UPI002F935858
MANTSTASSTKGLSTAYPHPCLSALIRRYVSKRRRWSAGGAEAARLRERDWQRAQLPDAIRDLVLDDQRLRSPICWNVFDD